MFTVFEVGLLKGRPLVNVIALQDNVQEILLCSRPGGAADPIKMKEKEDNGKRKKTSHYVHPSACQAREIPQPLATDSLHIGRYLTHVVPGSIDCLSYSPALCKSAGHTVRYIATVATSPSESM